MGSARKAVYESPTTNTATTSTNATAPSQWMDVTNFEGPISAWIVYTGASLNGTAKLQWSNDQTTAIDVTSSSQALAAGGGTLGWLLVPQGFNFLRILVTVADTNTVTINRASTNIVAKKAG